MDRKLWYGVSDGLPPWQDLSFQNIVPTSFKKLKNPWTCKDANGDILDVSKLSGIITKTQGHRGTICKFLPEEFTFDYIKNRLLGEPIPHVEEAQKARKKLLEKIKPVIKSLHDDDFEILCELIFANSGWHRTTRTGGRQKTIDIGLENPVTGETASVQVKTTSDQKEFDRYAKEHLSLDYDRLFYVYHTIKKDRQIENIPQDVLNISLWDLDYVAEQVIRNGLIDWVIDHSM